jgi:ribosome-associated protein
MISEESNLNKERLNNLEKELEFNYARSSGSGGQNVNKVSTKVQIRWDINNSLLFNFEEKMKIKKYLKNNISKEGFVFLDSENYREQIKNREFVVEKLKDLIKKALTPEKLRKPTKPTFSSKEKRISDKKELSNKKQLRKTPCA